MKSIFHSKQPKADSTFCHHHFSTLASIFAVLVCALVNVTVEHADAAVNLSNPNARQQAVERLASRSRQRKAAALAIAKSRGWMPKEIINNTTFELMAIEDGRIYTYKTCNVNAAISVGADLIRNTAPYNVNGAGLIAGLWDAGAVRPTHQEFTGRVTVMDSVSEHFHSTHVGGTIGAAGINPNALGMAPSVLIDSYEWFNDVSEMTSRAMSYPNEPDKIQVSNHSYGYASGWQNGTFSGSYGPHWFGTWGLGYRESENFGLYDSEVAEWDELCYNAKYFLPFKSAGNDRNDNSPAENETFYYWAYKFPFGWDWYDKKYKSSTDPCDDGWDNGGFDTIPVIGVAKNIMTIGAVDDAVTSGVRDPDKATMSSFSGWGPTDDGRIKPDIVANGIGLYSSMTGSDSSYATFSGTSMSAPNAAGAAMLLVDYYGQLFPGQAMRASTLKALIIHTADDRGNAGPDYTFGWGLMNAKAAADQIKSHNDSPDANKIAEGVLDDVNTMDTYTLEWDDSSPIRATLCWTDPPASGVNDLDNNSPRLINDLDLRIIDTNSLTTHYPYVLNPASPADAATTGDNTLDNVEQVVISSPVIPGIYTVQISYKGTLTNNYQYYSLILSGQLEPPEINIKQDSNNIASGSGSFDFGSVPVDANQTVTFTIENLGGSELELTGSPKVQISGTDANSFDVTTQPSSPVAGGGSTTFDIRFTPSAQGQKNAAVSIPNNDSDEDPYTFTITGTATVPEINVSQDSNNIANGSGSFDFGPVPVDANQTVTFTIENLGGSELVLTGSPKVQISGTDTNSFNVTTQPNSPVAGGGSTTFDIRFTPSAQGQKNAAVSIPNNDSDEDPYTFTITGTATVPEINVSQDSNDIPNGGAFNFGSLRLSQSRSVQFTVDNSGAAELYLSGLPAVQISGADVNSFTVTQQPSSVVGPGSSTTFDIEFAAAEQEREYLATVSIPNNDPNENPYTFDVNGIGVFPTIIYVDDDAVGYMDGSEEYPFDTINGGIGAAFDSSVVLVQPGTYYEVIDLNDTDPNVITITSSNPDDPNVITSTIIDGNDLGESVVTFDSAEDANCILIGFTITGANTPYGGGIYIDNASPLIEKNIITGNYATEQASGLYAANDSAIIRFNKFSGNDSTWATVTLQNSSGSFTNNLVVDNISDYDAGLYCDDGQPLVKNNTIANNETRDAVDNSSTGILLRSSDANTSATITNNIIADNINGTGIYDWADGGEPPLGKALDPNMFTYNNVFGHPGSDYYGLDDQNGINGNISVEPLFADPNNDDYHLKSQAGRWDPNSSLWVVDANSSRCIDTGNPGCPLGSEPSDANNVRINLGAYGGTAQASETPAGWGLLTDITNDYKVDFIDYAEFALYWLDNNQCLPADFDRNDDIDSADLAILTDDWLKSVE